MRLSSWFGVGLQDGHVSTIWPLLSGTLREVVGSVQCDSEVIRQA